MISTPPSTKMALSPLHPALVLGTCCLSLLMVMMDVTIVNVTLPAIAHDFGSNIALLQWVVDSYSLTVACGLILGGTLADRFGRRRIFLIGISTFCTGSLLCAIATDSTILYAARALQGVGGAMLNPVALSIIVNVFTEPRSRARAIGVWGAMSGLALGLGPLVGGLLSEHYGWRAVFLINLPLGCIAIALTWIIIPESKSAKPRRIDLIGQVSAATALCTLIAALILYPNASANHALIAFLAIVCATAISAFIWNGRTNPEPMIDLRCFYSAPLSCSLILAILVFAVFSAFLFLNTLYLQHDRGLTPLGAGLCTLPLALGVMCCAPISGRMVATFGARKPLLLAGLGLGVASAMLTQLETDTPLVYVLTAYALCGCGYGMSNAPITNAAATGLPRDQAGMAAAMASTSRLIGTTLGVAICGCIIAPKVATGIEFSLATHQAWWIAVFVSLTIAGLGFLATGARAIESANRTAKTLASEAN